jgi:squalene synthase HpnC
MTTTAEIRASKTHRDENFPVASLLIHPRHRGIILAFYRFARAADDVADHSALPEPEKLVRLDRLEETLLGKSDAAAEALPLRAALTERGLAPRHAQDLLTAFRMDVTKRRYQDWDDLIDYCTYSAMPVGRFVLDVHGESRDTWPASDALCAALQIINHLQDCGTDYRNLDRVYIPLDDLRREGVSVEALGGGKASPGLKRCVRHLAERTSTLLGQSKQFPGLVNDMRLGLEIAVIHRLARNLIALLLQRDPLSERVHLTAGGVTALTAAGIVEGIGLRMKRRWIAGRNTAQDA